jgi:hypothetical protein
MSENEYGCAGGWVKRLEAMRAERDEAVARAERAEADRDELAECMNRAGMQAFMRGRPPAEVADHLQRVIDSYDAAARAAEQERDELREYELRVAEAVGVVHAPDGQAAQAGPREVALAHIADAVRAAGRYWELWARTCATCAHYSEDTGGYCAEHGPSGFTPPCADWCCADWTVKP